MNKKELDTLIKKIEEKFRQIGVYDEVKDFFGVWWSRADYLWNNKQVVSVYGRNGKECTRWVC